jgi:hypothetical protein
VLKGFHQERLPVLFDTYPDAHIIWSHRDPVQAIASRIVLSGELDEGLTGHVDWKKTAQIQLESFRASLKKTLENPWINDPRIHHIRFVDFVSDPVKTIGAFYEKAGKKFPADTEKAMRDYVAGNKADRYGKFKYSTDVLHTDVDALHKEFAPYRERFGLEIEKKH